MFSLSFLILYLRLIFLMKILVSNNLVCNPIIYNKISGQKYKYHNNMITKQNQGLFAVFCLSLGYISQEIYNQISVF